MKFAFFESLFHEDSMTNGEKLVFTRRVTAPFSVAGSLGVLYMIAKEKKWYKWKSSSASSMNGTGGTYHRFMLGISITDVAFSLAFLFGLTPLPRGIVEGAKGTMATCSFRAFCIQWFGTLGPFYNAALELYYVALIRYQMQETQFARRFEMPIHIVSNVLALGGAIIGLIAKVYNPSVGAITGCYINSYPPGCTKNEDMVCTRGENAKPYFFWLGLFPYYLVLTTLYACLAIIVWTVLRRDMQARSFRRRVLQAREAPNTPTTNDVTTTVVHDNDNNHTSSQDHQPMKKRAARIASVMRSTVNPVLRVTKTVTAQALYYGVFFTLTYFFFAVFRSVIYFDDLARSNRNLFPLSVINSVFLPLQGLFNFLVFIRPKFRQMRRDFPQETRFWALRMVIQVIQNPASHVTERSAHTNHHHVRHTSVTNVDRSEPLRHEDEDQPTIEQPERMDYHDDEDQEEEEDFHDDT